jgi:hypothetical protein
MYFHQLIDLFHKNKLRYFLIGKTFIFIEKRKSRGVFSLNLFHQDFQN